MSFGLSGPSSGQTKTKSWYTECVRDITHYFRILWHLMTEVSLHDVILVEPLFLDKESVCNLVSGDSRCEFLRQFGTCSECFNFVWISFCPHVTWDAVWAEQGYSGASVAYSWAGASFTAQNWRWRCSEWDNCTDHKYGTDTVMETDGRGVWKLAFCSV